LTSPVVVREKWDVRPKLKEHGTLCIWMLRPTPCQVCWETHSITPKHVTGIAKRIGSVSNGEKLRVAARRETHCCRFRKITTHTKSCVYSKMNLKLIWACINAFLLRFKRFKSLRSPNLKAARAVYRMVFH
jgi:hypothetical protein